MISLSMDRACLRGKVLGRCRKGMDIRNGKKKEGAETRNNSLIIKTKPEKRSSKHYAPQTKIIYRFSQG